LHRDLKPGNIFLDSNSDVKLGDFGLARVMNNESQFAFTHVGTPYYMSPEQIMEQKYNQKSDIWSAGCVVYEIVSLRAPFEATNQIQLAHKIKKGEIDRIPAMYSDQLFQILKSMIEIE
jgi:NIMA (never in mitosis gene a)-related kinase